MKIGKDTKIFKFVVDASVVVKWFAHEDRTVEARLVLNRIIDADVLVYAPELLFYEVANALWKGKRLDKKALMASLETLSDCGIKFEQLNMPLTQTTIDFMVQYDLTFYDAIYVALANTLQIPLLTEDAKGHKKIKEIEILEL